MSRHARCRCLLPLHGAVSLGMRRLVVVLGALSTLMVTLGNWTALITALTGVPGPVFWSLMGPTLVLPLVAGAAAAAALYRTRMHRAGQSAATTGEPQWLDRVWQASLLLTVLGYAAAVLVTATVPLIPTLDAQIASRTTPLSGHYAIIGIAASVVLRARISVLCALLLAPPIALMLLQSRGQRVLLAIEEPLVVLSFVLAQIGALSWTLHQAAALDRAGARHRHDSIALAQERARTKARRRRDSFVHDHILSVLVAIAAGLKDAEHLRLAARDALASLQQPTTPRHRVPASTLFTTLATTTATLAPEMQTTTSTVDNHLLLPSEVAHAIQDAAGEAIRNSLRHAHVAISPEPSAIHRSLVLSSDAQQVRVMIADDGAGFDPSALPTGRHGITGSIHQRLRDVGATARIESAPGRGTVVTITWQQASSNPHRPPLLHDPIPDDPWQLDPPIQRRQVAAMMESPGARAIAVYGIASHLVIAILEMHLGSYATNLPVALSLLAQLTAALLLLRTWPKAAIPHWAAITVLAVLATSNLSVLLAFKYDGWPGFAAWATGSATSLCHGLLMRQHPRMAWIGQLLLMTTTAIWVHLTDRPTIIIITYILPHIVSLALWHLIVTCCITASTALETSQRQTASILAARQADQTMNQIMDRSMAAVRARTQPLLTQLATSPTPTPALRTQARLLEAELRDEIRAPFFTNTPVVHAARQARARGIDVLLLDDSHGSNNLPDTIKQQALHHVIHTIRTTTNGRIVVRVNPPGRPTLLSILSNEHTWQIGTDGAIHQPDTTHAPP